MISNESYRHDLRAYENLQLASPTLGYVCLAVLTIAFGITYLPVKRYDMGNGLFSQWIMCLAVSNLAFIIHLAIGSPVIWPITVLGGVFFSAGNVSSILIIKRLGMGVGMLLWSMVSLVLGWAASRFGWFGIQPEIPYNTGMNYAGVAFAALGTIFYVFIKPPDSMLNETHVNSTRVMESQTSVPTFEDNDQESALLEGNIYTQSLIILPVASNWSPTFQRFLGVGLALISGICYSVVFIPIIYTQETNAQASKRGIDYIGALGLGAFLGSTSFFILYGLVTRNRPEIPSPSIILPALLSGTLSGTAQTCWLIANEALQASITYPIASSMPGAIAALIGTAFFMEVQGRQNYIFLTLALICTFSGAILTGCSK